MIILYSLGFLWIFWYFYIIVMGLYRASLKGQLTTAAKILGFPAIVIGIVMDIIAQYTFATLIFMEWPKKGERLVTDRLQRYLAQGQGIRYQKAKWLCENLLDPFDDGHCL